MFTTKSNQIFSQAIADYHRFDKVDMPIDNPYKNGSIEYLLYLKNWIDTVQWHLEDIIRDPHIDPEIALKIKRRIDRSNQERTDMVEYIKVAKQYGVQIIPTFNSPGHIGGLYSLNKDLFDKGTATDYDSNCGKVTLLIENKNAYDFGQAVVKLYVDFFARVLQHCGG